MLFKFKEDLLLRMGNPNLDEYRTKLVPYSSMKNSFDVNGNKAYDFQLNTTSDSAYIVLKNFLLSRNIMILFINPLEK